MIREPGSADATAQELNRPPFATCTIEPRGDRDACQKNNSTRLNNGGEQSDMARDLMYLVGDAIGEWAKLYGLDNLPKSTVFSQALSLLNTYESTFPGQ